MKFIVIFSLLISAYIGNVKVFAEGTIENISGSDAVVSVDIKQLTQDPRTLEIPIAVSVYSKRNSDRVQINWELPDGISLIGEAQYFIEVKSDAPTVVNARIKPNQPGAYDIKLKTQMFSAEVNYVASDSTTIYVDKNLELIPQTEEYKSAKMRYNSSEFLKYFGIGLIVLLVIVTGWIFFKKWLDAEDKK